MSYLVNYTPARNSFFTTNGPTLNPLPILALVRELLAAGLDPDTATETYRRRMVRHYE
jgi:hypothetical protein